MTEDDMRSVMILGGVRRRHRLGDRRDGDAAC